jgi:hypothetical protein
MDFFSLNNLLLAWRRINTGTGHLYKRFFRPIYLAYEIALEENLKDLRDRLKGGSYRPHEPTRFYLPKASGLQRPITLLFLEDQIVLQCIANVFAEKLRHRREVVQNKTVYSNILQPKGSIFFVKDWRVSYHKFQDKINEYYQADLKWIAHFDLAAFYDTICHDLLLNILFPRSRKDIGDQINKYLLMWSASDKSAHHSHGIPQGTLASDFLAECFLLPVDESLTKDKIKYLRYCDDIRVFGKSEGQARAAIVKLEIYFRERGLIPQGAKHSIAEAHSLKEAMGTLPSIRSDQDTSPTESLLISPNTGYTKFRSAVKGHPLRIVDKSRARFALYHTKPHYKLTALVLKLMPHHPEHTDSFVYYLDRCKGSKSIVEKARTIVIASPYEYVQGEMWHILAKNNTLINPRQRPSLVKKAVSTISERKISLPLKWGILNFLCEAERVTSNNYSRFIEYQEPLLQGLSIPMLPDARFKDKPVIIQLLKRTSFEPSLMLAEQFVKRGLTHNSFSVKTQSLPSQTQNVYRKLSLIRGRRDRVDPMGELLAVRYGIAKYNGWKHILGQEYTHALQILNQADAVYDSSRSKWLQDHNAFNHCLFAELYSKLVSSKMLVMDRVINKSEEAKTVRAYGTLLNMNKNFSKMFPLIGIAFRDCNLRRNSLPGSHPYDNSGKQNRWLTLDEQKDLTRKLKIAYTEIIKVDQII